MEARDFRAEFPVTERLAYLNSGTDGPVPRRGYEAATAWLQAEVEDGRAGKAHFERLLGTRASLRERLAETLRCSSSDVALTGSTTDGMATALSVLPLGPGDEVVTSDVEHPGLLGPLEGARRRAGFDVRAVPFDELANGVGPATKLVACSHVSWADGRIADIEALRATGVRLVLDGAQGIGALDFAVEDLGCDFYAASGQKWLCGPDGSGSLWVRPGLAEEFFPPWPSWASLESAEQPSEVVAHPGARRFDVGVPPGAGCAWALASIELLQEAGLSWVADRAASLAGRLADELAERGFEVAPRGRTTLVSWRSADAQGDVARLTDARVTVRYLPGRGLVRASVGAWNSEEDLERLLDALGTPTSSKP